MDQQYGFEQYIDIFWRIEKYLKIKRIIEGKIKFCYKKERKEKEKAHELVTYWLLIFYQSSTS